MAWFFESLIGNFVILLGTILAVAYVTFRYQYGHWKRKGLHFSEPAFPFGNVWGSSLFRLSTAEEIKQLYDNAGGHKVSGIFMLHRPALIIRDPDLLRLILVKDFNHFVDRGFYFNEDKDHLSGHLFFMQGTKWRNLRAKLTPTFTSGKMKMMFQTMVECGKVLTEVLQGSADQEECVEIREIVARFSTDVIASCAFGVEVNCQKNPNAEFRQWGRRFFEPTWRTFITQTLAFMSPTLTALINMPFVPPDISGYFTKVVRETVEYRENNNVSRNDFMHLMIQLKNKGYIEGEKSLANGTDYANSKLTILEMAAQAFVFFLAGFETSSTTVSFCIYELARNQSIQEKLRKEIDDALEQNGGSITYDVLMTLPYLDNVLSETLRKYPPVPILNREVTKSYLLPGYDCVLEKGSTILIPVMGLHHDPKYFPDPEKFDPDRFNDSEKSKRPQYVYLPFGEGPRNCIGSRFGQLQAKVAIFFMLSKYEFLPSTLKPFKYDPSLIILTPVGGLKLKVKARGT